MTFSDTRTAASIAAASRCGYLNLLLSLTASGNGDPRAPHMSGTIEATALTASPTTHVSAIFLGLVPTVPTAYGDGS